MPLATAPESRDTTDIRVRRTLYTGFVAARSLEPVVNEPRCPRCRCGVDANAPIECDAAECPLPALFAEAGV